jgi:cysteine-rich repeat protein
MRLLSMQILALCAGSAWLAACGGDGGGGGNNAQPDVIDLGDTVADGAVADGSGTPDALDASDSGDASDADVECVDPCTVGDERCSGDVAERCTRRTNGCTAFTPVEDCSESGEACVEEGAEAGCGSAGPTCTDGEANGSESDVDCGGDCAPCEDGDACNEGTDCTSGLCDAGECASASCEDGVANGEETDIDCGGSECDACADGAACEVATDCVSELCDGDACRPETCANDAQDGDETDVDCGGSCAPCNTGRVCAIAGDCESGVCTDSVCAAPACDDGVSNGRESGVDCGGFCDPCEAGSPCRDLADCASGVCTDSVCRAPACDDGLRNGDESGVDCGGSCDPCPLGGGCLRPSDCVTVACEAGLCVAPGCDDGTRNGDETDVDCGGGCSPCAEGLGCAAAVDCLTGVCVSEVCVGPGCADGVRNGSETGVDCGGSCAGCDLGEPCGVGTDCGSGACSGGECVDAICGDGVRGGTEACDNGDANSDTLPDACRTTCTLPVCGDGVRDALEACDAGANNSNSVPNACRVGCRAPGCGDGVVDTGEGCDAGARNNDVLPNACRTSCATAFCGDGVTDTGELCDQGANNSDSLSDRCRTDCRPATCGDGVIDSGEECDNGARNGASACDLSCVRSGSLCDDVTSDYCVELPYGSSIFIEPTLRPSFAEFDIGFMVDTTGSMGGAIDQLQAAADGTMLSSIRAFAPGARFGVSGYGDFPCVPSTLGDDVPFALTQRISSDLAAVRAAFATLEAAGGGDLEESGWEGLWQVSTGWGRLNAALCGSTNASDVLVSPFEPTTGRVPGVADGALGGLGWRTEAARALFWVSDAPNHGRSATFNYGASQLEALDALRARGIPTFPLVRSDMATRIEYLQTADDTGAIVPACAFNGRRTATCTAGECCTGLDRAGVASLAGDCPLVMQTWTTSEAPTAARYATAALDAIRLWQDFGLLDVRLRPTALNDSWNNCVVGSVLAVSATPATSACGPSPAPAALGLTGQVDGFTNARFSSNLDFSIVLGNDCIRTNSDRVLEGAFDLMYGDAVLDRITVTVVVPAEPACVGAGCSVCGNGRLDAGEACDDGNTEDGDSCTAACRLATCGDGAINQPITGIRTFSVPVISDGFGDLGLVCDEGATCPEQTCNVSDLPNAPEHAICQRLGYSRARLVEYGTGIDRSTWSTVNPNEFLCEGFFCNPFRNAPSSSSCRSWETMIALECTGPLREQCDNGALNGTPGSACSAFCQQARCGDGIVGAGEACDDGNAINNDACTNFCTVRACGNGVVNAGEECDDANLIDTDSCSNDCRSTGCGNSLVGGTETCDNGAANSSNPNACRPTCVLPRCGDGVRDYGEACDDGNSSNTDSCTNSCRLPDCNNGIVNVGEVCDDGNAIPTDTCTNTCAAAACGDGFLQLSRGETCDDGNLNNGDGCSSSCATTTTTAVCTNLQLPSVVGTLASGSTAGRTNLWTIPTACRTGSSDGDAPDITFVWTAPYAGSFTIETAGSNFDTILSVSRLPTSTCPTTPTSCNDDVSGGTVGPSRVVISAARGERLLITIDGYVGASGNFVLSIR